MREAAQAEKTSLKKALVPQIYECLVLHIESPKFLNVSVTFSSDGFLLISMELHKELMP